MEHRFKSNGMIAACLAATTVSQANAMFVKTPPPSPPPRADVAIHRAPRHGLVWTPGYYRWRGSRYHWVPGMWVVPPHPGAIWIAPTWRYGHGGYTFVAGRWQ